MDHAKLSPSAAKRWLNCPGSVALSADVPRTYGEAARVGTGAHALSERVIKDAKGWTAKSYIGKTFEFDYNRAASQIEISEEMVEHVDVYLERIAFHLRRFPKHIRKFYPERYIDLQHIRPGMFGHSDAVVDGGSEVVVTDFKYGFHAVRIKDDAGKINEQLLVYGVGIGYEFDWLFDTMTLEIIQPRCFEVPPVQSVTISAEELREWSETVLWHGALAADQPYAPLNPSEAWCRWCPAAFKCPALRSKAEEVTRSMFSEVVPVKLTVPTDDESVLQILKWGGTIENWLKAVNGYALARARQGHILPGYKLVRGSKHRKWQESDPRDTASKLVQNGFPAADASKLWGDPYLKSPAEIEKISSTANKAVEAVAYKPEGELTLTVESDRRKAVTVESDFAQYFEIEAEEL